MALSLFGKFRTLIVQRNRVQFVNKWFCVLFAKKANYSQAFDANLILKLS